MGVYHVSLLLNAALLAFAVTYAQDVARIMAFHCNICHNSQTLAAGLDTSAYAGLIQAVDPGDPDRSVLVEFVEGRRGEHRRMPLNAPPLPEREILAIREWIRNGAKNDGVARAPRLIWKSKARGRFQVTCRIPDPAYATLRVTAAGRTLHQAGAPITDREYTWSVAPASHWPKTVEASVELTFAAGDRGGCTRN